MKYSAVIFDLYGTLISNMTGYNDWLKEMAVAISAPEDDFARLWNADFNKRMIGELEKSQDCLEHVCEQLALKVTKKQIERATNFRFDRTRDEMSAIQPLAIETISQLKAEGYKVALLSNCSVETTLVWDKTPFFNMFDVTIFSCSVGLMKPDLRIFQVASEQLKVKPEECLYIADGMDGELKAAASVGMTPVRIRFPDADINNPYLENWYGTTISSLQEVMDFVK